MYSYKVQICQKLHDGDFERRADLCSWFLQKYEQDPFLVGRLNMSDEARFGLIECISRQNFRFRGSGNVKETREITLYSERVTVWCAFLENKITGSYFFEECNI